MNSIVRRKPIVLVLEELEGRITPISGLGGPPPAYPPIVRGGTDLDPVVLFASTKSAIDAAGRTVPVNIGSGSLITTDPNRIGYGTILTAAHVIHNSSSFVDRAIIFRLADEAGAEKEIRVHVPGHSDFMRFHSKWFPSLSPEPYDIGVAVLTDPRSPGNGRMMVAPYFPSGAFSVSLNKTGIGDQLRLAGYGRTGDGNTPWVAPTGERRVGENFLELDANTISESVFTISKVAAAGNFQLSFRGNPTDAKKFPLSVASTSGNVRDALASILGGAANVEVFDVPNGWRVRLTGALSGARVANSRIGSLNPTIVDVAATTNNTFYRFRDTPTVFWDFDDPAAAWTDVFKNIYGIASKPATASEVSANPGDSGGPYLLGRSVVAVHNTGSYFIETDVNPGRDGTFGEYGAGTSVPATFGDFAGFLRIDPARTAAARAYDIVFDMDYQVYGKDKIAQKLTITARNIGGNLQLTVDSGTGGAYDGKVYFSGPANEVKSLTIRGSTADENTIVIEGDLGIGSDVLLEGGAVKNTFRIGTANRPYFAAGAKPIGIFGNGAADTVFVEMSGSKLAGVYEFDRGAGASTKVMINGVPLTIRMVGDVQVSAGSGDDVSRMRSVSPVVNSLAFNSGAGNDVITVGSVYSGVSQLPPLFSIDGVDDLDRIVVLNQATVATPATTTLRADKITFGKLSQVVAYKNVKNIDLIGGLGVDTFEILGTPFAVDSGVSILGNGGLDRTSLGGGVFTDIKANVRVNSLDGSLQLQNGNSTVPNAYSLSLGGLGYIINVDAENKYSVSYNVRSLEILSGKKADTFAFNALDAATSYFVDAGVGDNSFTLGSPTEGLNGIGSDLIAVTRGTNATVIIDDEKAGGNRNIVATGLAASTKYTWGAGVTAEFMYDGLVLVDEKIKRAGAKAAKVAIEGVPAGVNVAVVGSGGTNDVVVGRNGLIDGVVGPISLVGDDSVKSVLINDSASNNADAFDLSSGGLLIGRVPNFNITFGKVAELAVRSGSASDSFSISGLPESALLRLDGGLGTDTVKVSKGSVVDPSLASIEAIELSGGSFTIDNAAISLQTLTQTGGSWLGGGLTGLPWSLMR